MSQLYYWSPGAGSGQTSLGGDDHYFRLGAYDGAHEPSEADVKEAGTAQGIYFYTSGKYSLKTTGALHQAVEGPVTRTVQTGNLTYTNDGGDLSITLTEGAVTMTAKSDISITSAMNSTTATSIKVDAGTDHDIYYQQALYVKSTKHYEEKMVKGNEHKTNIGFLINAHGGVGYTTSMGLELSYSSFSFGFNLLELSTKGVSFNDEHFKKSFVPLATVSFTVIEGKTVAIDEEYCVLKNETKWFRFSSSFCYGMAHMCKAYHCYLWHDAATAKTELAAMHAAM